MSVRETRPRRVRRGSALLVGGLSALTLTAACTNGISPGNGQSGGGSDQEPQAATSSSAPPVSAASISATIHSGAKHVRVDKTFGLSVKDGTFDRVAVRSRGHRLNGEMNEDGTSWSASSLLEPGRRYKAVAVATDEDGVSRTKRLRFRAADLTLDQQTYPSFVPVAGDTVGVGMPVIVRFDVPVTNHKSIEKHLSVTSSPSTRGSWHWISDYEVHWRPAHYWKAGTKVTVKADINSIPAGHGIFGQLDRTSTFTIGDKVIHRVNLDTDQMKTFINGNLARTTPVTGGKPGFETRSGVKVIVEKFRSKDMDAATTGISQGDAEYYNISNVEYAMRVTYTGEFLHAAPWSVGSQGYANVSHGCVGMSTANAQWVYDHTKVGDVVDVTGSSRPMTLDNGYGDWNESFKEYKKGSALS